MMSTIYQKIINFASFISLRSVPNDIYLKFQYNLYLNLENLRVTHGNHDRTLIINFEIYAYLTI